MNKFTEIILVAGGGMAGAVLRFILSGLTVNSKFLGIPNPGTTLVNLSGCFCIGIVVALFEKDSFSQNVYLLLVVGILGGFTTFSAFGIEIFSLIKANEFSAAIIKFLVNNLGGIILVATGYFLIRLIS